MARPSNGKTLTLPILLALQKLPHEIRKLLLPPGPIVVHILAPEINPCRHSKPFKLLLQNPCVLFASSSHAPCPQQIIILPRRNCSTNG